MFLSYRILRVRAIRVIFLKLSNPWLLRIRLKFNPEFGVVRLIGLFYNLTGHQSIVSSGNCYRIIRITYSLLLIGEFRF